MLHEQWYRLFRTYVNLFQEEYKLYFMQMVAQLYISKEMCIFHVSVILSIPCIPNVTDLHQSCNSSYLLHYQN